jgi:hypothetical protein
MGKTGLRQVAKTWLGNILSTVGVLTLLFYAGRFLLYQFGDAPYVVKEVPITAAMVLTLDGRAAIVWKFTFPRQV